MCPHIRHICVKFWSAPWWPGPGLHVNQWARPPPGGGPPMPGPELWPPIQNQSSGPRHGGRDRNSIGKNHKTGSRGDPTGPEVLLLRFFPIEFWSAPWWPGPELWLRIRGQSSGSIMRAVLVVPTYLCEVLVRAMVAGTGTSRKLISQCAPTYLCEVLAPCLLL